ECWTGLHEMAMVAFESHYIDKDTYSTSAEDIEVQSCFLDDQLTNLSPPRNCKAVSSKPVSFGYQRPMLMESLR
ncbi:hypothetical protein Tco_0379774, partial [Tanacetum coccineum]